MNSIPRRHASAVARHLPPIRGKRRAGDLGESLLEVLAAVVMVGVLVPPMIEAIGSLTSWIIEDQESVQALAYAKQGVDIIRSTVLQDYAASSTPSNFTLPPPPTPPTLSSVKGVSYTESFSGPVTPAWDTPGSGAAVGMYTVTVSWMPPVTGHLRNLTLTTVVDPSVAQ